MSEGRRKGVRERGRSGWMDEWIEIDIVDEKEFKKEVEGQGKEE